MYAAGAIALGMAGTFFVVGAASHVTATFAYRRILQLSPALVSTHPLASVLCESSVPVVSVTLIWRFTSLCCICTLHLSRCLAVNTYLLWCGHLDGMELLQRNLANRFVGHVDGFYVETAPCVARGYQDASKSSSTQFGSKLREVHLG